MFQRSGIVDTVGGPGHFVKSVEEALQMTELEDLTDFYRDTEAAG